jgi:hypothetical protein
MLRYTQVTSDPSEIHVQSYILIQCRLVHFRKVSARAASPTGLGAVMVEQCCHMQCSLLDCFRPLIRKLLSPISGWSKNSLRARNDFWSSGTHVVNTKRICRITRLKYGEVYCNNKSTRVSDNGWKGNITHVYRHCVCQTLIRKRNKNRHKNCLSIRVI